MGKKEFANLTKSTDNISADGLSNLFASKGITDNKPVQHKESTVTTKPQTFNVSIADLEFLKDFVYYKKTQGDFEYNQRKALTEAIGLLREKYPEVKSR